MPRVELTRQLRRFTGVDGVATVEGATVGEVLDAFFALHPTVRPYVVDEHGAVRRHVVVFLNGRQLVDRTGLGEAVGPDDELHVFQALSGG
ncbi:MAG TPA: MoaD/ThiS family protein [Acidimicrobiales bacterium]|nr:MoaD/ThiS family protein [Acidimicrobiales bacterium]